MRAFKCPLESGVFILSLLIITFSITGCEKLITIPEPDYSITTAKVFTTDKKANSALAGAYSTMNNMGWAGSGQSTVLAGQSADELLATGNSSTNIIHTNRLQARVEFGGTGLWQSAYSTIYETNAILEGVAASVSPMLSDSARIQLTGEAKFIRAFCYFYLTNFFGDVPLVMTTDFNKTSRMSRTPQQQVYQQIIRDLKDARELLPGDYRVSNGERIRVNKWAAAAMLARTYLYIRDYENAAIQATDVIANNQQYKLENDLNEVFSTDSKEAIWQLKQNFNEPNYGNAIPEGVRFLPEPIKTGVPHFEVSSQLINAFEPNDNRKAVWVGTTDQTGGFGGQPRIAYFPYKYKTGSGNYSIGVQPPEYYMVLRLAEQYLIRAEARANGAEGGGAAAIADLNTVRHRAGLDDLPDNLQQPDLIAAVEKEWRLEFFCEWGHRWFNLKRTGRASVVLPAITYKQPWLGDYQLLYPIPVNEILYNNNLVQNKDY